MEIIKHRINTIQQLQTLPPQFGAEFDVRSFHGKLILNHEPHAAGDLLENFLSICAKQKCGTLVVNPKEDGLEEEILALLSQYKIDHFFFLDLTIPTMVKLGVRKKIKNLAARISEYETLESALTLKGIADWVWLDSFAGEPPSQKLVESIKKHFKICLVSPELQGHPCEKIVEFRPLTPLLDAVCTKYEKLWIA